MAKEFLYEEHVAEINQLADELPDIIDYDEWSAREYGSTDVDYTWTAFNLLKAGYRKTKNTRLYNYAMEHIESIAEEQLCCTSSSGNGPWIWITGDLIAFDNYSDALKHQIAYLLEEDDEE